ncbi:MAG: PilZ domain-containing protein [Candidatus Sulfotelmatobacter sp.]
MHEQLQALWREGSQETVSGEGTQEQLTVDAQAESAIKHYAEMQSAPRFPLHLPVELKSQGEACTAETQNISANGVLFAMDRDVPVGSIVDFTILLPGDVVGSRCDVQIDCHGRVVRSFEDKGRRGVGVVIDEYHFERA